MSGGAKKREQAVVEMNGATNSNETYILCKFLIKIVAE